MASPLLAHPLPAPGPTSCCRRLVVLSTCEQLSGGYQFGPFVARLLPKVAWLIYVLLACFLYSLLPLLLHLLLRLLLVRSWVFYYANDKIFINVININFGNNSRLRKIMRNDRGDKRLVHLPDNAITRARRTPALARPTGESILIVCEGVGGGALPHQLKLPTPTTASTPRGESTQRLMTAFRITFTQGEHCIFYAGSDWLTGGMGEGEGQSRSKRLEACSG